MKAFRAFIKPFKVPLNFFSSSGIGRGRVKDTSIFIWWKGSTSLILAQVYKKLKHSETLHVSTWSVHCQSVHKICENIVPSVPTRENTGLWKLASSHILRSQFCSYNKTVCFHIQLVLVYTYISEQALIYLPKPLHPPSFFKILLFFSLTLHTKEQNAQFEQRKFSLAPI